MQMVRCLIKLDYLHAWLLHKDQLLHEFHLQQRVLLLLGRIQNQMEAVLFSALQFLLTMETKVLS